MTTAEPYVRTDPKAPTPGPWLAASETDGPLASLRVVDLTTVVMGPFATQILGDLGADVIKVEAPAGDHMRWIGPAVHNGMGPLFLQANRNKRSVVLDLKEADDRSALLALVAHADVFVSNVRPDAMRRLGLDQETLSALNPGLICCSAVGFGSDGPLSGTAVYDDLMQAASGISGLFATVDGAPRYAPINVSDRVVGLYVVIAVLSALAHRQQTGRGQSVEVPMFETMTQFVLGDHIGGAAFSPAIGPMGYRRLLSRTRGPYPTADGHLSLVVYTTRHWRAFSQLVGDPDLLDRDPRFATPDSRTVYAESLGSYLAEHLPQRSTADWMAVLRENDIPASPVNRLEDLLADEHLRSVGMFEERVHPTEGTTVVPRFPICFGASPASVRSLAPNLGEHTAAVLASIREQDEQHHHH